MSEAELREGLRATIRDEPPLRFDPDELIHRAKQARQRRRALVAVAVATLVLTGTVLSLPGVFDHRSGIDVAEAPVLTTTASPPPSAAPSGEPVRTTPAPPEATSVPGPVPVDTDHLASRLTARFLRVKPDLMVLETGFTDTRGKERAGYVTGFLHFADAEGPNGLTVQLSAPPLLVTRDQFCAGAACAPPRRRPDGSYLEFATIEDPSSRMVVHSVAHFRTDGSVVQVNGYNYDPTSGDHLRDVVPLSVDQLAELATDPTLSMS